MKRLMKVFFAILIIMGLLLIPLIPVKQPLIAIAKIEVLKSKNFKVLGYRTLEKNNWQSLGIKSAEAEVVSLVGLLTYLTGGIWQSPKTFHLLDGVVYLSIYIDPPKSTRDELKMNPDEYIIIHPECKNVVMGNHGLKFYTFASEAGFKTYAHIFFPENRDTAVKLGKVKIYQSSFPKEEKIGQDSLAFESDFSSNGLVVELPTKVNSLPYTANVFINRPVKVKGETSFQYEACNPLILANKTGYQEKAGRIVNSFQKAELDKQRTAELKILLRENNLDKAKSFNRPISFAIFDNLGEVYRGPVINSQTFKVYPGYVRVTRLPNEIGIASIPESSTGVFQLKSEQENALILYPCDSFTATPPYQNQKINGQLKVYTDPGAKIYIKASALDEKPAEITFNMPAGSIYETPIISSFKHLSGTIEVIINGQSYSRTIHGMGQVIVNCLSPQEYYYWRYHDGNPAVPGGFVFFPEFQNHFLNHQDFWRKYMSLLGIPAHTQERYFQKIAKTKDGEAQIIFTHPTLKNGYVNGKKIAFVNEFWKMTFGNFQIIDKMVKVAWTNRDKPSIGWIIPDEYGYVLYVDAYCGNAGLHWVKPQPITPPIARKPVPLPEAPPEEKIPAMELVISSGRGDIGAKTVVPSTISPYIPPSQIRVNSDNNINVSPTQTQSQTQNQGQTNSPTFNNNPSFTNDSSIVNINNNTNVNDIPININNTNTNINQNLNP